MSFSFPDFEFKSLSSSHVTFGTPTVPPQACRDMLKLGNRPDTLPTASRYWRTIRYASCLSLHAMPCHASGCMTMQCSAYRNNDLLTYHADRKSLTTSRSPTCVHAFYLQAYLRIWLVSGQGWRLRKHSLSSQRKDGGMNKR